MRPYTNYNDAALARALAEAKAGTSHAPRDDFGRRSDIAAIEAEQARRRAAVTLPPPVAHQPGIDPERDAVFCAALSGICANPAFFGPLLQQSPQAAVDFAAAVVARAFKDPTQ